MNRVGSIVGVGLLLGFVAVMGFWAGRSFENNPEAFPVPFVNEPTPTPLVAYSIDALSQRQFLAREIVIGEVVAEEEGYTTYSFTFQPLGRAMSGVINIPTTLDPLTPAPSIIMLRGYVPLEIYAPGVGTKNAAAVFAKAGYVTIAPDFFGYGSSAPEPSDTWLSRFEKPVVVAELIRTLQTKPVVVPASPVTVGTIGIWAHSNGGQIALTTLEILGESYPTSLWAPVTAPFPYSILFFSDENADEGKEARKWVSLFEETYDVFQFSLTRHLDKLTAPLQLHHGTSDEAAIITWSDEFAQKIAAENELRSNQATPAAEIELTYFRYPGADHNLQPSWNTVIQRDLTFFSTHLKN